MEDRLIDFQTAELAKEKGFNVNVYNFYNKETKNSKPYLTTGIEYDSDKDIEWDWNLLGGESGNLHKSFPYPNNPKGEVYSAPTQSLLQKWLRDKHKIDILPYPIVMIRGEKEIEQEFPEYTFKLYIKGVMQYVDSKNFNTYENVFEVGLVEGLNKITIL